MMTTIEASAPSKQEIAAWIIAWLAEETGIAASEIEVEQSLLNYSMSSISATILVGDIEDWLGLTLEPTLAWDYPSIAAIVDHLADLLARAPTDA